VIGEPRQIEVLVPALAVSGCAMDLMVPPRIRITIRNFILKILWLNFTMFL
jgi:hypothetical protein